MILLVAGLLLLPFSKTQELLSNEILLQNIHQSINKYQTTQINDINSVKQANGHVSKLSLGHFPNGDKYGLISLNQFNNPNFQNPSDIKYGLQNGNKQQGFGVKKPYIDKDQQFDVKGAIESISKYDTLQCIPKLLCDFMIERTGQKPSLLHNVDLSSVMSFIQAIGNGARQTPLLMYGKAALVGYTANGDIRQCFKSYPQCPSHPDDLVEYLNNHNGGFFRFFSGLPKPNQKEDKYGFQNRILNKPAEFLTNYPNSDQNYWKFPNNDVYKHQYNFDDNVRQEYIYDNGKFIPYHRKYKSIKFKQNDINALQQLGVTFPDRTGTGEFLIDSDKFSVFKQTRHPNFNENKIKFISNYK